MNKKVSICLVGSEDAHKRIGLAQCLIRNNFDVTILGTKDYAYPEGIRYLGYNLRPFWNIEEFLKAITLTLSRHLIRNRPLSYRSQYLALNPK